MRALSLVVTASFALVLSATVVRAQTDSATREVRLFHITDTHLIYGPRGAPGSGDLAQASALHKSLKAGVERSLFLHSGDLIAPSPNSRLFEGADVIEAMNTLGLDAVTFGNHEFDYGADIIERRMRESRFPWITANVRRASTGGLFGGAAEVLVRDLSGVRVGIFALTTVTTASTSSAGSDVLFENHLEAAFRAVEQLRLKNVDLIVALTHLDDEHDRELARRVPGVDVILGGHEHEKLIETIGKTQLIKMPHNLLEMSEVRVEIARDRSSAGRVRVTAVNTHSIEQVPVRDAMTARVLDKNQARWEQMSHESIAELESKLDARTDHIRSRESVIGNMIADALRAESGSDVVLVNAGSVRAGRVIPPGSLTLGDLWGVFPFRDSLVHLELSGAVLERVISHALGPSAKQRGAFPMLSGVAITRRFPLEVRVAGEPLVKTKSYRVSVNGYILKGGSGFDFSGARVVPSHQSAEGHSQDMLELLARNLRAQRRLNPTLDGRIQLEGRLAGPRSCRDIF